MTILTLTHPQLADRIHAALADYDCIHAATAPVAHLRLREQHADVIVCDDHAVKRGDFLPLLLARPQTARIPVILVSAQHLATPPNVLMRVRSVAELPDALSLVYDPSCLGLGLMCNQNSYIFR